MASELPDSFLTKTTYPMSGPREHVTALKSDLLLLHNRLDALETLPAKTVIAHMAANKNLAASTAFQDIDGWTEIQDIDGKLASADLTTGAGETWEVQVSGSLTLNSGNAAHLSIYFRPVDSGVAGSDAASIIFNVGANRFMPFSLRVLLPGAAARVWRMQMAFNVTPGVVPVLVAGAAYKAQMILPL